MTVAYYVGTTGTGKTTLMCNHGIAKAAERGVPAILLDSEGVVGRDKFDADLVTDLPALVDKVWRDGQHARFHPRGPDEVARLAEIIRVGKDCVLLIDEVSYWGRGASPVPELARLYRIHRHSRLDLYATSQYPGDISPLIWNIRSDTFVFRNDSLRATERLEEELRLDRHEADGIAHLENLKYLHFKTGVVRTPTSLGAPVSGEPSPDPERRPVAGPDPGPAKTPPRPGRQNEVDVNLDVK